MRPRLGIEKIDVAAPFPWRHDFWRIHAREHQRRSGSFAGYEEFGTGRWLGLRLLDEFPQPLSADRIEHEVHAVVGAAIMHFVALEGIEHPALAGLHVHRLAAASEGHAGIRDDGNVDAQVRAPVIMAVDVRGHFRAGASPISRLRPQVPPSSASLP